MEPEATPLTVPARSPTPSRESGREGCLHLSSPSFSEQLQQRAYPCGCCVRRKTDLHVRRCWRSLSTWPKADNVFSQNDRTRRPTRTRLNEIFTALPDYP